MKTYKQFLTETFINAVGDKDREIKEKYVDQVWDILQNSYKDIGGIHGSGFKSKEDMIDNIPFWKMAKKGDKIVAVIMYKGKGGRKSVAMGTDGSTVGKKEVLRMISEDATQARAFGEKSKGALGALIKSVPWDVLEGLMLTPEQAGKALGKSVIALKDYDGEIPEDGVATLKRFPELKKYAYMREIGGEYHFKVSSGVPGMKITS